MERMVDGEVAFVPSYCNTAISFDVFVILAAKKISCYHETTNGERLSSSSSK